MSWVRPLISLVAMLGITIGFSTGKISPEAFMSVAAFAITYWFKSRDESKIRGQ